MKLLFLILFSVFTIESALAPNFKMCKKIFPLKKLNRDDTLANLNSTNPLERKKAIQKVLETHEPAVAESLFLEALKNIRHYAPSFQMELIKALAVIDGSQTQSAFVEIFKDENAKLIFKLATIVFIPDKNYQRTDLLNEEFAQTMIQILEGNSNKNLKRLALEFLKKDRGILLPIDVFFSILDTLKNSQNLQDVALFLEHRNSFGSYTARDEIQKILKTRKPEDAENIFLHALTDAPQNTYFQWHLLEALKIVAGSQTQLFLSNWIGFREKEINYISKTLVIRFGS